MTICRACDACRKAKKRCEALEGSQRCKRCTEKGFICRRRTSRSGGVFRNGKKINPPPEVIVEARDPDWEEVDWDDDRGDNEEDEQEQEVSRCESQLHGEFQDQNRIAQQSYSAVPAMDLGIQPTNSLSMDIRGHNLNGYGPMISSSGNQDLRVCRIPHRQIQPEVGPSWMQPISHNVHERVSMPFMQPQSFAQSIEPSSRPAHHVRQGLSMWSGEELGQSSASAPNIQNFPVMDQFQSPAAMFSGQIAADPAFMEPAQDLYSHPQPILEGLSEHYPHSRTQYTSIPPPMAVSMLPTATQEMQRDTRFGLVQAGPEAYPMEVYPTEATHTKQSAQQDLYEPQGGNGSGWYNEQRLDIGPFISTHES